MSFSKTLQDILYKWKMLNLGNATVQDCCLPHLLISKVFPTSLEGALDHPAFLSRSCGRYMELGQDLSFSLLYSSIYSTYLITKTTIAKVNT